MSKKRDTRFQPGQSGNPAGRPRGSGLAGQLRRAIQDDAHEVIQMLIEQAKAGDIQAATVLLDRIVPKLRPEAQAVELDQLGNGGLVERAEAVLTAAAAGELAPDVAAQLVTSVATLARVVEVDELQQRLTALEQRLTDRSSNP